MKTQIIQENKKAIWIIISILLTIGLNMSINMSTNKISFDGNQIIWLFLCVFSYQVLKNANKYKEKRLIVCSVILGILFATFQTIGKLSYNYWSNNEIVLNKTSILLIK